jgi:broad specificity phosphatase PhoE
LLRWISGQHDGQYAESWPDFNKRVDAALQTALERRCETVVFTSGGTISVIARLLWQIPDTSWPQVNRVIANASITKLVIGRSGLHLSTFNDHSPFEGSSRHLLTYR